ncbi:hypothetical protein CR513_50612, partial [Mucuna pruriens]
MERDIITMFIDTLPSLHYDRIVGNVAFNFADLVRRLHQETHVGKEERRDQRRTGRAGLPPGEGKCSLIPDTDPSRIQINNSAISTIHSPMSTVRRRWGSHQHKASIAKHEETP